jgi:hypothetical protein
MTKRERSLSTKRTKPTLLDAGRDEKTGRLDAKFGTYKVDAYVSMMFPKAIDKAGTNRNQLSVLLRQEINRAAQVAVAREYQERIGRRTARKRAKRVLGWLDGVEREAAGLFPGDAATNAAEIDQGFASNNRASIQALVQIMEGVKSLSEWAAELRRIGIADPPPPHSDPLARHFIDLMASAYIARLGREPGSGRKGPFVDLVTAAWIDLDFPQPEASDDLQEWLGTKVERRRRAAAYRI